MLETGISWLTDRQKKFIPVAKENYAAYSSRVQFLNDSFPGIFSNASTNTFLVRAPRGERGAEWLGGPLLCPSQGTPLTLLSHPPQDVDNEHFIVWMRPAALPSFRKLYGRIETDLPANTELVFSVFANFPVAGFSGSKHLVVSTLSWVGGKNPFLGIAYLVVGFACIGMAVLFGGRELMGFGRKPGTYPTNNNSRR